MQRKIIDTHLKRQQEEEAVDWASNRKSELLIERENLRKLNEVYKTEAVDKINKEKLSK